MLYNGLGRYADAMASAELASEQRDDLAFANLALAELIEAAVRGGQPERAAAAMGRLTELTLPSGTAWGLGVAARSRALLSEGDEAERLYRVATVARELDRIAARIKPDVLAVTDASGRTVAVSGRLAAGWPATLPGADGDAPRLACCCCRPGASGWPARTSCCRTMSSVGSSWPPRWTASTRASSRRSPVPPP